MKAEEKLKCMSAERNPLKMPLFFKDVQNPERMLEEWRAEAVSSAIILLLVM